MTEPSLFDDDPEFDPFPPAAWGVTLIEAQNALRDELEPGSRCPCCGQYVKAYARAMTAFTGKSMIMMYRHHRNEYVQIPTLIRRYLPDMTQGGYATLGSYWGLIEEEKERREDGGRAGWWRLTDSGIQFVLGWLSVPRQAVIYDTKLLRYQGETVTIRDVVKKQFDYDALMHGNA